ncbi:MAG: FeoA family protein [Christensenellales bacterium]|jgi:ferrous iron transport protein A|nr:ferrous iron transport protein A [Clostridiales bacterium]
MMPLSMSKQGTSSAIMRVTGKSETKNFLGNLGFTPGEKVTVICEVGGNLIVEIKNCRVALSKELARNIMI